jgi:hypothetical protein
MVYITFNLSRGKNETDLRIPHITIAVAPGHSSKESNDIDDWIEIDNPFYIKGIVKEKQN